jgi:hypothetical protein
LNLIGLRVGKVTVSALGIGIAAVTCFAQAAPQPDVLVLVDGEKLIGHLEKADATNVVFKSDLAGEVKIDWSKIKDLQTSDKFAIAQKGQTFSKHDDPAKVPQGTLEVADQKVTITPASGTPLVVAVANTENVIPQASFMNAFKHPAFKDYWHGAASAGFALVQSTQKSKTFTSALNLVRTVPDEAWFSPRYRTTLDFESAYGTSSSKGVNIETNVIHAGLEQDQYLNNRLFAFGDVSFDHNYSQGLSLQYTLGGGLGYVAYKDAHQELDLKGQIAYISQQFDGKPTTHLIGALLGETYTRSLSRGMTFNEALSIIPAFNEPKAWTANFLANLDVPVQKKIDFTIGLLDNYLNDPPPSFQKNSFQIITAITYKIN